MVAHIHRLPFTLHPLVAEARRRARRRRVLLAVVVIALGGGAGGAVVATHPFGWLSASGSAGPYQPGYLVYPVSLAFLGLQAPSLTVSVSRRAAWIAGSGVVWRWNGRAWGSVPLPPSSDISAVTSIGRDDAWAVGRSRIVHWTGRNWTVVPIGGPFAGSPSLSAISAAGPRDVWVAGTVSTAESGTQFWRKAQPLLLHWEGLALREEALPWARPGLGIRTVVATGPSSVWVVPEASGRQPALEHWNGSRWRAVPAPFGSSDPPFGFTATSGNDAWAVGSYRTGAGGGMRTHPLAAHWNGSFWTFTKIPSLPGDNDLLLGDVAGGSGEAWAIGQVQPVIPNAAVSPKLVLLHWDGSRWTVSPGAFDSSWYGSLAIATAGDGTAWAIANCGNDNAVLGWDGARWKVVPHPPDQQARGPVRPRAMSSCSAAASGR